MSAKFQESTPSALDPLATPSYWKKACTHLGKRDRIMCRLIAKYPNVCLQSQGNAFVTLARSIVGQQISVKAAQSVWDKLLAQITQDQKTLHPQDILGQSEETLRAAGLSKRKVEYIQDLATHFANGNICPEQWQELEDEAIITKLIAVRGVGRWTAEMFLIFYMLRPNIFPLDDVGLLKGISQTYFSGEPVSRAEARELGDAWMPYRTVATWYIWRSLDPLPVAY